ncbi:MAG: hypothetical protein ACI3YF_10455, partial [Prevotella sp.]
LGRYSWHLGDLKAMFSAPKRGLWLRQDATPGSRNYPNDDGQEVLKNVIATVSRKFFTFLTTPFAPLVVI